MVQAYIWELAQKEALRMENTQVSIFQVIRGMVGSCHLSRFEDHDSLWQSILAAMMSGSYKTTSSAPLLCQSRTHRV
jgi:hypothetical protein